jgi:hypothetical protein
MRERVPDVGQLQKVLLAGILNEIRTRSGSDRMRALDHRGSSRPAHGFIQKAQQLFR